MFSPKNSTAALKVELISLAQKFMNWKKSLCCPCNWSQVK